MFGMGTKSEHEAIFLSTPKGDYLLRRQAANPFEVDRELNALVGKKVRVSGKLIGDRTGNRTLVISDWQANEHA